MRDVLRAGADKVSLNTAAVADPDLVVLFSDSAGARIVDDEGREQPPPAPDRRVTEIRRGEEVLAIVVHGRERSAVDGQDVDRLIGGAARLAIDNERLARLHNRRELGPAQTSDALGFDGHSMTA